ANWAKRRKISRTDCQSVSDGTGPCGTSGRIANPSYYHLPLKEKHPTLDWQTGSPVFVAAFGGKPPRLAWITTPFLLERAKSAKTGGAKPRALALSWEAGCRRVERKANSPFLPATCGTPGVVPRSRGPV